MGNRGELNRGPRKNAGGMDDQVMVKNMNFGGNSPWSCVCVCISNSSPINVLLWRKHMAALTQGWNFIRWLRQKDNGLKILEI